MYCRCFVCLSRTHYALGTGCRPWILSTDLYERWETWAADIAESHTIYLALVRFRSPQPGREAAALLLPLVEWVTVNTPDATEAS
jgi:hypothetical protein